MVTDLSDRTTKTYIASRGENLLTNGTALLGDNTNFSSFTFDGANANSSPGSFRFIGPGTVYTDEFMPVLAEKRYKMSVDAKTLNGVGRYYMMTVAFDVDNQVIGATHHMYRANTLTTLASELNNGDTVVYLTSAANWYNSGTAGVSTYLRSIILWNYTNSFGYTYPPLTYSRNWFGNAWDPGSIDLVNNTITLRVPWAGGTVPAGTQLSNGSAGGSFKYNILANTLLTTSWTTYTGFMDGIDYSGANVTTKFPPGTAKIKLGWLMNYAGTGETAWFTNMTVGLDDNAHTATTLQTSRNINGTSFNGSTDITTSSWGTAQNVTIGNTTRSVNGATTYSWSLSDIGAQAALTNPVTGTGTSNFLPKWSSTNNLTNSIIYDNGTNVGIGTSSPSSTLHVSGNTILDGWIQVPNIGPIMPGTISGFVVSDGDFLGLSNSISDYLGDIGVGISQPSYKLDVRYKAEAADGLAVLRDGSPNDGILIGEQAYTASSDYQGITHPLLTGSQDYMMISRGDSTYVSSKSGFLTYIRAGGNSTTYELAISASAATLGGNRLQLLGTETVLNEAGGNFDFRIEGDTDPNLLFVDASVDDVGIGTNNPAAKLHIAGDTLFENLSYRRFTTSTATATHFRKYTDIAHYANSVSSVAGSLRIEIPVTTSTMWSMDVVIVEYDGGNGNNIKTTNLTITGYTTTNTNRGVWTNNPSRINQVRFGRNTANNRTVILIDPVSVFRYPKAYIKEINTHHGNETTFGNSANYAITITSDETNFTLNGTITNDQFIRDDKLVNTFGNQTVAGNKTFDGNVVINEIGGNFDFRVEGDTDQNLLFTDASTDRVGIGTSFPSQKLDVSTSEISLAGFNSYPLYAPVASGDYQSLIIENRSDSIITKHMENTANSSSTLVLKNLIRYGANFISIDDAYVAGLGITYYPRLKVNTDTGAVTINESYTFPTTDGSSGQALVTNGSGVVSWSDIASANLTRGSFEVTSTQSTFTVSGGYTLNTLSVYYNGVKLLLGTDFTATNGTTFTLTNASVSGDIVEYWALNSASSAVGNTSTGSVSVTSNQTIFNVTNGYTVGGLIVFVNGVKLVDGVDFTATNGSSFTLTSTATSGDVVDYIAYGAVVASSNLQKTGDTMTGNLTIGNGSDLIVEGDLIVAKYKEGFVNIGNTGSAQTIDISSGTLQTCILNSSCTFTMPTAEAGRSFTLLLKTGTGSFTSTFTNVKWPNDTAPTITTTTSKMDILTFVSDGVNWYGNISQNYTV